MSKTEDYLQLKLSSLLKDNETLEHISKMYESYNSTLIDEVQELRKENKELKEQIEKLQPKTEEECSYSRLEKENERLQNLLDILVDAIEVMVPLLGKTMAKADIGGESSSSLSTIKEEGEVDTLERVKAVAEGYNKLFNFTRFGLRWCWYGQFFSKAREIDISMLLHHLFNDVRLHVGYNFVIVILIQSQVSSMSDVMH